MKKRKNAYYEEKIHNKTILCVILGILFLICLGICIILEEFQVDTVYVEGNQHYTAEEIKEIVEKGRFGDNSIFLSLYYRNKSITDVPFVERMDVDVLDRNSIKVSVYEKSLAGYVQYLGSYLYFDKDGIIVESSDKITEGIPLVTGLDFSYFIMYQKLPVENQEIFQDILTVTQLLNKYDIAVDRIFFNEEENMTLYFDDVRVDMGSMTLLEEKIQRLDAILPSLEDQDGELDMSAYENNSDTFTFTKDSDDSVSENIIVSPVSSNEILTTTE